MGFNISSFIYVIKQKHQILKNNESNNNDSIAISFESPTLEYKTNNDHIK